MELQRIKDKKIMFFIWLGIFIVALIPIFFLSSIVFIDEIGTVANAAHLVGIDWSNFIGTEGAYYKYGQAIIYLPAFLLFQNSTLIYKAMLVINAITLSFIPVIVYSLCRKHFSEISIKMAIVFSVIIGILPSGLLLSKYVWAETTLFLMQWILIFLILESYDAEENSIKKRINSILIAMCSVYAFMCHQRGIVFIIASIIVIVLVQIFLKTKLVKYRYYIPSMILMLGIDIIVSSYFKNALGLNTKAVANTVGNAVKSNMITNIFTVSGIKVLIKEICGWALSIFTGTYGLILVGIIASCIAIKFFIKERKSQKEVILATFGIMIFIGAFALGVIFFFEATYNFYIGTEIRRADRLIYSRYLDSVSGILCFLGIYYLCYKQNFIKKSTKVISIICTGICIVFSNFYIINRIDNTSVWLPVLFSVGNFIDTKNMGQGFVEIPQLHYPILLSFILAFIIGLMLLFVKKHRIILGILICCFLTTYVWETYSIIYRVNIYYSQNIQCAKELIGKFEKSGIESPRVIFDSSVQSDLLRVAFQFSYPNTNVISQRDEDYYTDKDAIIISPTGEYMEEIFDDDYYDTGFKNKFFHVYIKGEKLEQKAIGAGIKTKKINVKDVY